LAAWLLTQFRFTKGATDGLDSFSTWIIPGQVPTSYQTLFDSEATCKAAQVAVLNSAQSIKQQMWQEAGNSNVLKLNATTSFPHVSAVCSPK
jgi:hypothetical protein